MTSTISISTTIDNLIQRTNEVKVCQEQLKIIANDLTRLQQGLNDTHSTLDDNRLQEDIAQILKPIDEIVTSCSDKETNLNGITYRDLESLLLRLHWRLVQYEANMTDDYQMQIQILSNVYQKQQLLVQKAFDETMKQKLQTIEQCTKENTTERLRLLREKHTETIESYLRGCIELHKSVPITDVTNDIIAKVTQTFYHISAEDQIQFEHNEQVFELPLTCTFTKLKPDKCTPFERNEARRLLMRSSDNLFEDSYREGDISKGIWQKLVSAPYMLSMLEQDQKLKEEDISEENIIRTKRWIVILGDPGSGKTSFARWLVHHLAQTLLLNEQHSTEYGPLRIPILIRIGEFAKILKDYPSLTLFDYIGKHKWMGKAIVDDPSISLDNLSCALQDYIKHGQALIILDGLDEIPVSDLRSKMIDVIQNFVDTYVQTSTDASAFDNSHLIRLFDDPSKTGGNQLIVTSRIVGYHAAPLAGQFAHYTIQPMDIKRMKDFIDYWFSNVHQQILNHFHFPLINQGENHGEILKIELEKPDNISLLNMASNMCLLSSICGMTFNQSEGLTLPIQRILLYEQIVNSILSLWCRERANTDILQLIRMFSSLAYYICKYSASNTINEEEIKEICIESIKNSTNKTLLTEEDIQDIERQASLYAEIICEDVDILSTRGESLYGFLQLTLQEYFTCLKLIDVDQSKQKKLIDHELDRENEIQLIAQSLRHHSNNARFRVPIALAFDKLSTAWPQKDFDNLCYEFLQEQDQSDKLLPLSAYTLITCGNDLVNYPSNSILLDCLDRLMIAAGQHKWSSVCPFLFDQITTALRKLRNDIVPLWINTFLSRSPSYDIQTISAFCHLIEGKPHDFENIKWLNQSSCSILQSLLPLDNENNGFAIDRLLIKVAFSNKQTLPVIATTLKEFLLTEEIQSNSIPVILFPLIIALYGGLKRDGQTIIFDPSHIHRESTVVTSLLIRFLSIKDRSKQDQALKKLKQECVKAFLARIENHDESSEAVDLCIATVCFYDMEYVQDNLKIISSSLLRLTMNRLKYISMILRQFYFTGEENDRCIENETTKLISIVIEKFQYVESARVEFLDLLNSLRSGIARLRCSQTSILVEGESKPDKRVTLHLPNTLRKEDKFINGLLSTDIRFASDRNSCTLLHQFTKLFWISEDNEEFATQYRVYVALDTVPEYLVFRHDEDLLSSLTFVPPHLQNLYLRLLKQNFIVIGSNNSTGNDKQHLYFSHLLTECLMLLSNSSCKRLSILTALIALLPWLRIEQLENFGSSLLWALGTKYSDYLATVEIKRQRPMNYETGQYMDTDENIFSGFDIVDEQRGALIKRYIKEEQERLQMALTENKERSMKLYSAVVSLTRICHWTEDDRRLCLLEKSVQGAMSITNKLARVDALCVIAFYSHSDYDRIQVSTGRSLQQEIEYQFNDIYPTLPLLLHTTIFIRCLPLLQNQSLIDMSLHNLFDKFGNTDQRDQQAASEALLPYIQLNSAFSSITKCFSHSLPDSNRIVHNKSSILKKYFNISADESLSFSLIIFNLFLVELANDFYECIKTDERQFTIDESIIINLFQFENSILSETQALIITNILSVASSTNRSQQSEPLYVILNNALHRVSLVELKACRLLESWLKWKDSNELSPFAWHAALLLINSDLWSVEAVTIVCDLLCCEDDRFRQRAEIIFRSSSDHHVRTSSKLGIDVLLTLIKKRTHYRLTSASGSLTLNRIFGNITLDVQSQLETFLWLERYKIHALNNKEYLLNKSRSWTNSYIASYFSTDMIVEAFSCINLCKLSGDLIIYICDMIASNLFSFLEIDGDRTSNSVLESHAQFVISVVLGLHDLFNDMDTQQLVVEALMNLFEMSNNDEIRRAVACSLGYVCNKKTYKSLFEKVQIAVAINSSTTSNDSNHVLSALLSSYCHCISIKDLNFDQDDMDLFCSLLKHPSENVLKAARTGLGRVLKDKSFLFEMLGSDAIQCYHALIDATAYVFLYDVQQNSENTVAEFVEEHPAFLSIFIVELYNSIRHFTNSVIPLGGKDYDLAYGYPQYVRIASLVAIRMSEAFCAYINDWHDGDSLKRALFHTSKQHNFPQRAACLTILSMFGELTVDLCEMFIEAVSDDPYIQNTCYKCLTRIHSIKDKDAVLRKLSSYLKSMSMSIRYIACIILIHLSKSSLIPSKQVQIILNDLMLDPSSSQDLWLIEEQDNILARCIYYYAGPLRDVIYSLLIQYFTGNTSGIVRRKELNDIDLDFIKSKTASRLASCLYEAKTEESVEIETSPTPNHDVDNSGITTSPDLALSDNNSD